MLLANDMYKLFIKYFIIGVNLILNQIYLLLYIYKIYSVKSCKFYIIFVWPISLIRLKRKILTKGKGHGKFDFFLLKNIPFYMLIIFYSIYFIVIRPFLLSRIHQNL
jgi:hypothetical protein